MDKRWFLYGYFLSLGVGAIMALVIPVALAIGHLGGLVFDYFYLVTILIGAVVSAGVCAYALGERL